MNSNDAFWCAYHTVQAASLRHERTHEEAKYRAQLKVIAQSKLDESHTNRLSALETATQVYSEKSPEFARELNANDAFVDTSTKLSDGLKKAARELSKASSKDALVKGKEALEETLSIADEVVNALMEFRFRVNQMEEDITQSEDCTKKVEHAQTELEIAINNHREAEEKEKKAAGELRHAEAALQTVKGRLCWGSHMPQDHLLLICKFAGEEGRRSFACACTDFSKTINLGRTNGHFQHQVLVLMTDQRDSSRSPVDRHFVNGHKFSLEDGNRLLAASCTNSHIHTGRIRTKFAAVAVGNKIYMLGGRMIPADGNFKGENPTNTCLVYDGVKSLKWRPIASMSRPRELFQAAVISGKILVIGGTDRGTQQPKQCEVYDPGTDTWTLVANLPTSREQHASVVFGDRLFHIGGLVNRQYVRSVDTFNMTTGQWAAVHTMTSRRGACAVEVFQNRVIVMGGRNNTNVLNTCEAWNPATDQWEHMQPLIATRWNSVACVLSGRLFVFGGRGQSNSVHSSVEEYLSDTNTWTQLEGAMCRPRSKTPMSKQSVCTEPLTVCLGNGLLILGGDNARLTKDPAKMAEKFDLESGTWSVVDPICDIGSVKTSAVSCAIVKSCM